MPSSVPSVSRALSHPEKVKDETRRRVNEADFLTPDEKREAVGYGKK